MRTRMKDLAARRAALVGQADVQRALAADAAASICRGLASVERGVSVLRHLVRKPLAVALGVAGIALLCAKPRQTATWLGYAITTYTMFRRARRALSPQR
jgi:propanediol dehydratase large subunit